MRGQRRPKAGVDSARKTARPLEGSGAVEKVVEKGVEEVVEKGVEEVVEETQGSGGSETSQAGGSVGGEAVDSQMDRGAAGVVQKRLRNAKKRLAKLHALQKREEKGDVLNAEQKEALGQLCVQEGVVEELEKVLEVVGGETNDGAEVVRKVAAENAGLDEEQGRRVQELEVENGALKEAMRGLRLSQAGMEERQMQETERGVRELVRLLYCACLFDPFVPYQVEKTAVLAWMHQTEGSGVDLPRMSEMLDAIGVLGKMMTRRPLGEGKSHEESVRYCQDVALRYVLGGEESVLGWSGFMTKAHVEQVLGRVTQSEYFRRESMLYGSGSGGERVQGVQGSTAAKLQRDKASSVATPSPKEDAGAGGLVGMAAEGSESADSSSEMAEVSPAAAAVDKSGHVEVQVKKKTYGGKKKQKGKQGGKGDTKKGGSGDHGATAAKKRTGQRALAKNKGSNASKI
jgi:hypothetical protein